MLGVVAKHESCSTHCTRRPHSPSKMLLSENGSVGDTTGFSADLWKDIAVGKPSTEFTMKLEA